MKKNYIEECLERANAATEGPWWVEPERYVKREDGSEVLIDMEVAYGTQGDLSDTFNLYDSYNEKDYQFIAHTDVVELAMRLKKACEALRMDPSEDRYITQLELADELEAPLEKNKE
jgi:hypothetical protein